MQIERGKGKKERKKRKEKEMKEDKRKNREKKRIKHYLYKGRKKYLGLKCLYLFLHSWSLGH
jgi:hypothetical protein